MGHVLGFDLVADLAPYPAQDLAPDLVWAWASIGVGEDMGMEIGLNLVGSISRKHPMNLQLDFPVVETQAMQD